MSRKWKTKPNGPSTKKLKASKAETKSFRITATSETTITAAQGEGKLATFSGRAYTGKPMRPDGWWGPLIIDLAGVVRTRSAQVPILRQHDHEQIVGHADRDGIKASREGIDVAGVLSGQAEHTDKVTVPAKNGFKWQLSVGGDPIRTEYLESGEKTTVNGMEVTGPLTISRETEIGEISFVPLGADGDTSATVAASKGVENMNKFALALKELVAELRAAGTPKAMKAAKYTEAEIDEMSASEARAAMKECMAAMDDEDGDEGEDKKTEAARLFSIQATGKQAFEAAQAEARKAGAAEAKRQADITAAVKKHGITDAEVDMADGKKHKVNLTAHAIENGWTADKAELTALREARAQQTQNVIGVPGGLGYTTTTPQVNDAVFEAALLHAARHQFKLEDDSFYCDHSPDGRIIRRVPERMQREAQGELKSRYTDQVQQAAHTLFKGRIGLQDFFRCAMRASGVNGEIDLRTEGGVRSMLQAWGSQTSIRAEGSSNLSISNILANVLNKFALQGYLFTEQSWREVAGIRPVNDFKPAKSINLLGDVIYKQVGPSGELSNASLGDQAFANQAAPYGRILTLPWTHIVNDDLGMLTGAPMKIGQGAGLALNDYFWSLWAAMATASTVNGVAAPNGDDGNAFWRTSTSTTAAAKRAGTAYLANKDTGAALSATTLKTGKALFDNQIDPNGNPLGFDGAMPVLLFGPSNWTTAMTLLEAEYIVAAGLASTSAYSSAPNKNIWRGQMKPVMSRYIENATYGNSTTAFWILFNPAALPVIEVAFLNGVDTPAVLQAAPEYQFDKLGISIRGTMPFGVTQQNFRGGVFNAGA